jgi:integrase
MIMARDGRAPNRSSSAYKGADGYWHGRVSMGVDDTGKPDRRHVMAASRAEVARKIRELERLRDSGRAATAGRAPTVATGLTHRLENIAARTVRRRTMDGYRTYIERYAIPSLGGHRLDRLQPEHIEALYSRMEHDGLAPGTVHSLHRILRAALNEAVRRDKLLRNPVQRARPPRLVEREMEPLSHQDATRLVTVANEQPGGARWSVALALGLRQGEALGLSWDDVDLDQGIVTVRRALQRHTSRHGCGGSCGHSSVADCPERIPGGLVLVEPKSRAGRRRIALPAPLIERLRSHRHDQRKQRLLAGSLWEEHGLVFTQPTGRPIDPRSDSGHWKALLATAGVRDARLHDARRTAATLLLVQGVNARTVMDVMGWTEARMLSRYQHVDELRRDAADRMGEALWPGSGGSDGFEARFARTSTNGPARTSTNGATETRTETKDHLRTTRPRSETQNRRSEGLSRSRLGESNPRPTHYECVALTD